MQSRVDEIVRRLDKLHYNGSVGAQSVSHQNLKRIRIKRERAQLEAELDLERQLIASNARVRVDPASPPKASARDKGKEPDR